MKKARIATYLANILDHFDTSLYGFLVPILAPLFFPKSEPVVALIQGYGVVVIGFITRPLGAWYFGKQADVIGPHAALITTIMGMTITTFCFTLLQPYELWGVGGAIGLCLLRGIQNFFGAGEASIAGLYVLEGVQPEKQHPMTSMYLVTQMGGILLAGAVANVIFCSDNPQLYWKWPFYGSLLTGIAGWWLRKQSVIIPGQARSQMYKFLDSRLRGNYKRFSFKTNWRSILRLLPITGMYYIFYSAPFVFFNSFAALVTKTSIKNLMASSTALMFFDLGLLIILGPIIRKMDSKQLLLKILAATVVIIPFLFWLLPFVDLIGAIVIRMMMITLGVAFCIPLHRWYIEEFPAYNRYTTTAIGYAIGTETLGRSFPAVGLALWHFTHSSIVPGIYIALVSLCAYLSIALPKAWKIRYKWSQRFLLSSLRKKGFNR
jgi:MFS family permease